ncbi:ATP-binding cassette domain-containing protein [Lacinutrix salivirga]
MNHLHVDSVTKSYNGKAILTDVYLSNEVGEITGLIGRNGSGKSTLLKIIFGTEKAEFKFVRANNKKIKNVSDGRHLINYLPQNNFLPNGIKIKNLIKLFLPKKHRNNLLENSHLKPLLNKKNQELSTGEKRIVEILLIAYSNAKFILLDEPFNGVSPIIKTSIINIITELKSCKGFIITDHDYENVINLADKIMYLNKGYLKEINNEKELLDFGYLTPSIYNDLYNKSL